MTNYQKHLGSALVLLIFIVLSYASTLSGIINRVSLEPCSGQDYDEYEAQHNYNFTIKVFDWDLNLVQNTPVNVEIIKYKTTRWDNEYCVRIVTDHKKLVIPTNSSGEIQLSETYNWYGFMDYLSIKASVADAQYTKDFDSCGRNYDSKADTNVSFNLYTKKKSTL